VDFLRNLFSRTLGLGSEKREKLLDELSLEGVTRFIQSDRCQNIICMVGAGISTSAGIPDFRSPTTGLYSNLEKYNLPYPEAIFEINYFKKHPEPFFALARELYPGQFKPTVCHYFIRLLKEKGLLLRCYTQVRTSRVGSLAWPDAFPLHLFSGWTLSGCFSFSGSFLFVCVSLLAARLLSFCLWLSSPSPCLPVSSLSLCLSPDIVFFGETLPARFFSYMQSVSVDLLVSRTRFPTSLSLTCRKRNRGCGEQRYFPRVFVF
uniref:NAD-dependent protein deacetylase sirtuin-2 n=1 Tax=Monodelphis domestica TaxID=13616 RepID=F6U2S4_MONDO